MTSSETALPASLALVGAGRMGTAMLQGWLAMGLPADAVSIFEPAPSPDLMALCSDKGLRLNPSLQQTSAPDVLVLAIKPQMLDAAAPGLAPLAGKGTLVLSILAGKRIADLAARFPLAAAIVRTMPNTPAAIGRGISGVAANAAVTECQRGFTTALLGAVGQVEWLADECLIDAVTAVSGSGPAYVFLLAESLAKAGEAAGLPADLALRLARATVEGSGELMRLSPGTPPSTLRENVTSPGGTTAAALAVLMGAEGLDPLMRDAVAAALRRAGELSG
ncbi:MAG: pyrroline-5-carboxylate reductase [Hyphomicrobiales bacterium]|nr:pyrroline-5-carboxylate reductase [Hyphomicrobiales bacterium]